MVFLGDTRAQSVQIGAVLLFAILIVAFSIHQAYVIPDQNQEVEFNHFTKTQGELQDLRNAIIFAGETGNRVPASVQLGTSYPARLVAAQPQQSSGSLRITNIGKESNTFSLRNGPTSASIADICGLSTVNTSIVTYEPNYNYMDTIGNVTTENTITYTNGKPEGQSFQTDQVLIDGTTVHLYPLVGEYDQSAQSRESLTFHGNMTGTKSYNDDFELVVPTRLSASQWEKILLNGENRQSRVNEVVPASGQAVKIVFDDANYNINCSPVGIGKDPNNNPEYVAGDGGGGGDIQGPEVTRISTDKVSVSQGDKFNLTAVVDDRGRGGSDIIQAQWSSNKSTKVAPKTQFNMSASDGEFDQPIESVQNLSISTTGWTDGRHELSVHGRDGNLTRGPPNSTIIDISPLNSAESVQIVSSRKTDNNDEVFDPSQDTVKFTIENTGSSAVRMQNITVRDVENSRVEQVGNGTVTLNRGWNWNDEGPEFSSNRTGSLYDSTDGPISLGTLMTFQSSETVSAGEQTEYTITEFRDSSPGGLGGNTDPGSQVTVVLGFEDGSEKTVTLDDL